MPPFDYTAESAGESVGVGAFGTVLEHLSGYCVDTHFKGLAVALDVKRIAQAAAALFLLKLLIGDGAGTRFERLGTSNGQRYLGLGGKVGTLLLPHWLPRTRQ